MDDIDLKSAIAEMQGAGIGDQDIADNLRSKGFSENSYKSFLPKAQFAAAATSPESQNAANTLVPNFFSGIENFAAQHPIETGLATAALGLGGGYMLSNKKQETPDLHTQRMQELEYKMKLLDLQEREAKLAGKAAQPVINAPADLAANQAGAKTPSEVLEEFKAFKAAQAPQQPPVAVAPPEPSVLAPEAPVATPVAAPEAKPAPIVTEESIIPAEKVKKVLPTAALPPESEFKPAYKSSTKNPKGAGAYSWLVGQEGNVKGKQVWEDLVGPKNISYNELMGTKESPGVLKRTYEAYQGSYGEPDPFKAQSRVSANPSPKYVPKYIEGAVAPEMLNSLLNKAGVAAALMASKEAGAPTVRQEQPLQAGRGFVNPPNVDPKDWGKYYPKLIQAIQQLFGDTAPYQH